MVKYPDRAARALGFLKRPYNDIEIYVEDVTCVNMYNILFKRIIGDRARFTSVNAVGNEQAVIDCCRKDQASDGRKRLYIVDGDLDFLAGNSVPRLKFLYQIDAYSIENLLICKEACIEIGRDSLTDSDAEDVAKIIDYNSWSGTDLLPLVMLFIVYAIVHSGNLGVSTVQYSVFRLVRHQGDVVRVDRRAVKARVYDLIKAAKSSLGRSQYYRTKREIMNQIPEDTEQQLMRVSGKDYLIPLLYRRLYGLVRYRGTQRQLRVRLARYCSLTRDPRLAKRLRLSASWR